MYFRIIPYSDSCGPASPVSKTYQPESGRDSWGATKKGQPVWVGLVGIGGGGGSRTRVRKSYVPGPTCLSHRLISFCGNTKGRAHRRTSPFNLTTADRQLPWRSCVNDPTSAGTGTQRFRGLDLKRPERSCRCWQLKVSSWIYEESYPLGMHQVIS